MNGSSHQWSPEHQEAIVLDLVLGRETLAGLAHEYHLTAGQILGWKERFITGCRLRQNGVAS
jgi:transposase-like protein